MMRTILYLTCSPRGPLAHSRTISGRGRRAAAGGISGSAASSSAIWSQRRRLRGRAASPRRSGGAAGFACTPALATSEALIGELEACDAVVIGTPMNNYTVPATLKAWIDQIVRIHRTFRSTPQGKVGLLRDRPVYVVIASGGYFTGPSPTGTPRAAGFPDDISAGDLRHHRHHRSAVHHAGGCDSRSRGPGAGAWGGRGGSMPGATRAQAPEAAATGEAVCLQTRAAGVSRAVALTLPPRKRKQL